MNKIQVLKLLNDLKISKDKYVILSSASLVIRDIYEECGDIDIAVSLDGFEELKRNYDLIDKGNNWYKISDDIECVVGSKNLKKEKYNEFYLQNIHQYYDFVKSKNREKDKERISILEKYIKENSI